MDFKKAFDEFNPKNIDGRDHIFEAGWRAREDSLKCCGCCLYYDWLALTRRYTCVNELSEFGGEPHAVNHICDKWEAR